MSCLGSLREPAKQQGWHRCSSEWGRQLRHYCVGPQRLRSAVGEQLPEPVEQQHCDALLPEPWDGSVNQEQRLVLDEPGQAQGGPRSAWAEAEHSTGFG